jgi:alkylation response protein AidB-like acyl-CoA dehydrogenase
MADIKTILAENEKISHETLRANTDQIDHARRFPRENPQTLGKAGVLGLLIPAQHGGAGAGIAEMSQVLDTQAQNCASTAMVTLTTTKKAFPGREIPDRLLVGSCDASADLPLDWHFD